MKYMYYGVNYSESKSFDAEDDKKAFNHMKDTVYPNTALGFIRCIRPGAATAAKDGWFVLANYGTLAEKAIGWLYQDTASESQELCEKPDWKKREHLEMNLQRLERFMLMCPGYYMPSETEEKLRKEVETLKAENHTLTAKLRQEADSGSTAPLALTVENKTLKVENSRLKMILASMKDRQLADLRDMAHKIESWRNKLRELRVDKDGWER